MQYCVCDVLNELPTYMHAWADIYHSVVSYDDM